MSEEELARLLCAHIDGAEYVDSLYVRGTPQIARYGFFVPPNSRPLWHEYVLAAHDILSRFDVTPKP